MKILGFSWILFYPRNFNHENFQTMDLSGEMVLTLEKNISAKSFYYLIHENFPLKINPLYGNQNQYLQIFNIVCGRWLSSNLILSHNLCVWQFKHPNTMPTVLWTGNGLSCDWIRIIILILAFTFACRQKKCHIIHHMKFTAMHWNLSHLWFCAQVYLCITTIMLVNS